MSKEEKAIQWAYQYLSSHGYMLKNNQPEIIQSTPWSQVVRFAISDGWIYLKCTPTLIALEADIIPILRQYTSSVPVVIAKNTELDCFLMNDAGTSLREILKRKFDAELFCMAIDQFTSLQISVADHVDSLFDIGVPDWRLNKLPDLYMQLLMQEKHLLMEDGLSKNEIIQLEKLYPAITDLCTKLSAYSIKQTIVQPDFNDNNSLIDDTCKHITIVDLGEISISHPFFSLINGLLQMKKHHGLKDENEAYLRIKDACLNNYLAFESREHLLSAFDLARLLWPVYWALAHHRLMMACGKEKLMSFHGHGKLVGQLKELLSYL